MNFAQQWFWSRASLFESYITHGIFVKKREVGDGLNNCIFNQLGKMKIKKKEYILEWKFNNTWIVTGNSSHDQNQKCLTHLLLLISFYTPWKHQKTITFSGAFRGYRNRPMSRNGLSISLFDFNPLSTNPKKWPNTPKQFVGNNCWILRNF